VGGGIGGGRSSGSDEEDGADAASSDDEDPLLGIKSSKPVTGRAAGPTAALAAPSSPPFVNPYSFAQRAAAADSGSFSSSDSESLPAPPPNIKKLHPAAAAVKLPAVHAALTPGVVGGGPLLSGYDSWSEDEADVDGAADDDDWSDTETPQQPSPHVAPLQKLKPLAAVSNSPGAAVPSPGPSERVEAWAARHAGGGLLGLMLHMRRCALPSKALFFMNTSPVTSCSALDRRLPEAEPPLTPQSTAQQVQHARQSRAPVAC
jgi:hypothetical protein